MNKAAYPTGYRYMNESVGAFFLITLIIAGVVLFQTGRLQRWFETSKTLRVRLPKEGFYGLGPGSAVEILGVHAGTVESIKIGDDQKIHAYLRVREDLAGFLTLKSEAIIRKRFGVAGDAFLEITRGTGPPLDFQGATINARADKASTDTLVNVLEEIRDQALPALKQSRRGFSAWADVGERLNSPDGDFAKMVANGNKIAERLEKGEGVIGQLMTDQKLASDLRQMLGQLKTDLARVGPLMDDLEKVSKDAGDISSKLVEGTKDFPQLASQTGKTLESLQSIVADIKKMMPHLIKVAKQAEDTTQDMPLLVQQTQQTLRDLQVLIRQMQKNWLVAGMRAPARKESKNIPPEQVLP